MSSITPTRQYHEPSIDYYDEPITVKRRKSLLCKLFTFVLSPLVLFALLCLLVFLYYNFKNTPVDLNKSRDFFKNFRIGGHRGVIGDVPENSITAFQMAMDSGADLIELDVMLTQDKKAIIMHDDTTDRTADKKRVVSATTLEEIKKMKLLPSREEIPTFEEALQFVKKNNLSVIIDVKDHSDEMVNEICRQINNLFLYDQAIVSSFNPLVPYLIKKMDGQILTGITFRRWSLSTLTEDDSVKRHPYYINWIYSLIDSFLYYSITSFILPNFLGTEMILANHLDISPKLVTVAQNNGFQIVSWTTNSVQEANFLRYLNVPFLTDLPSVIKSIKANDL